MEVRKITGIELNSRTRRSSSIPSMPRHLDVEHAEVGRIVADRLERGRRIRIDAGDEAFLLKRDRHRSQDVAVVVDQRDHLAHPLLSLPQPLDATALSQRASRDTRQRAGAF